MTTDTEVKPTPTEERALDLDLAELVGRTVTLFSEQFPGRPLRSRVMAARDGEVSIDRSGTDGRIDNLVSNQEVVMKFEYHGQAVATQAMLKRRQGGQCHIVIGERVVPLSKRKYRRMDLRCRVRLAALPRTQLQPRKLSELRWVETDTINLSSGGTLVTMNSYLEPGVYVVINIDLGHLGFPLLLAGCVRHCFQRSDGEYCAGIEFIIQEKREDHFSSTSLRQLPNNLFRYSDSDRRALNREIIAWMQEVNSEEPMGEKA
jgi:hypothetical protein